MNRELLKKISLFADLTDQDLDELSTHIKRIPYAARTPIFWMDEIGEQLFIIQSGDIQISYTDERGRDITLAKLGPGSFFGELSLIDGGPHTATARAHTDVVLLSLDRSSFYLFIEKHPQFCRSLLHVLSSRLRSSTIKMRGIINANEQLEVKISPFQKFIEGLARIFTSGVFLAISTLFIILWISVQVYFFKQDHHAPISFLDKPPTFFLLGFIFTLTSFLLTILILSSQRRQAENDRIRGEIEYQVNLKSQTEVMKLQLKMDKVIQVLQEYTGIDVISDNPDERVTL